MYTNVAGGSSICLFRSLLWATGESLEETIMRMIKIYGGAHILASVAPCSLSAHVPALKNLKCVLNVSGSVCAGAPLKPPPVTC